MNKLLVVATGNPGKLREMQAYLADSGWELALKPEDLDVEETGETFGQTGRYDLLSASSITGYRTNENITVVQRQFFLNDFLFSLSRWEFLFVGITKTLKEGFVQYVGKHITTIF
jgi:hypothetical protein